MSLKKKLFFMFAILFSALLFVAGCGSDSKSDEGEKGQGEASGEPQDGGTLRLAFGADEFKSTLIPGLATDAFNQNLTRILFDGLADENGELELEPRLAKEWELASDNMSMTVTLNEDAKWSDGEPITSDDVLFSYNAFVSPAMLSLGGDGGSDLSTIIGYSAIQDGEEESFEDTDGFEKISDFEFTLHFNEKDATSISNILTMRPIPKHMLEDTPINEWQNHDYVQEPGVTSGPYHVKEVRKPTTTFMESNDDYYLGKPHIPEIISEGVNVDVVPGLFANGELDYMMKGFNVADVQNLEQIDNAEVIAKPGDVFQYIGLKLYQPQFQSLEVRQALMYALPRDLMLDSIYKGNGVLLNGPITEIIGSHATEEDGINPYEHDVDKANALLDEAGWEKDADGNRIDPHTDEPAVLSIMYKQDSKPDQAIADSVQKYLGDIGIEIKLSPADGTTQNDKLQNDDEDVDMWIGAWGAIGDDPRGLWSTGAAWNWPRYEDETNDELIRETYATEDAFDEEKREETLIDWQLHINEELPMLFLWTYFDVAVKSDRFNIPEKDLTDLGSLYNAHEWWIEQ